MSEVRAARNPWWHRLVEDVVDRAIDAACLADDLGTNPDLEAEFRALRHAVDALEAECHRRRRFRGQEVFQKSRAMVWGRA